MDAFDDYAHWYRASVRCAACRGCPHLVNANLRKDESAVVEECRIVPQPGFMDRRYFDAGKSGVWRVLLLGINPGAGRQLYGANGDHELYGSWLPQIAAACDPAQALRGALPNIRRAAEGYDVLRGIWTPLKAAVKEVLGATVFGYSNQILCRTTKRATEIQSPLERPADECWRRRLLPLLHIARPDMVVAMGRSWFPGELTDRLDEAAERGELHEKPAYRVVVHPAADSFRLQREVAKVEEKARRLLASRHGVRPDGG